MATLDVFGGGSGLTFQGVPLTGGNSVGTGGRSTTSTVNDPRQAALMQMIMDQFARTGGSVPELTMAALENFTRNPSAAAEYFPDLAKPLVEALRPSEDREITQLNDMFRKAGGPASGAMQSGAYAQAGRQLIGDQANRRQQVLAQNYVPLTNQLSENIANAIGLGLKVPEATSEGLKVPTVLATSLRPLSSTTESIGVAPGPGLDPSVMTHQMRNNQADSARWWDWWNS